MFTTKSHVEFFDDDDSSNKNFHCQSTDLMHVLRVYVFALYIQTVKKKIIKKKN